MERRRVAVDEVSDLLSWPPKNPGDVAEYDLDWKLGDDRIVTSRWEVPPGITGRHAYHDHTVATIWLAGGELGGRYELVNEITTSIGRTLSRRVRIKIKAK